MKRQPMSPLEQIAYDAFLKFTNADTPQTRREVLRAWNEWRAVKEGRAEPLPQYR